MTASDLAQMTATPSCRWSCLTRLAVLLTLGMAIGCGSPTASDDGDDPPTRATYEGNWKGVAKRQSCAAADGSCDSAFQLAFFDLNLSVANGQLAGTLRIGAITLTVTGSLESDGALTLTGTGTNGLLTLTLDAWKTTVAGSTMSGTITLRTQGTSPAFARTASLTLERVVRQGTAAASTALPLDLRFAIRAVDGYAARVDRGSIAPPTIEYGGCYYIDNAAGATVRLTLRATPVGADGRDYEVQAVPYMSTSSSNNFLDCHVAAIDSNVTRPLAPTVRLRAEYSYDDGVSGTYDATVPVR